MLEGQKSSRSVSKMSVYTCPAFLRSQGISSNAGYFKNPLPFVADAISSRLTGKIRNQPKRFAFGDLPLHCAILSVYQRALRPRATGAPV